MCVLSSAIKYNGTKKNRFLHFFRLSQKLFGRKITPFSSSSYSMVIFFADIHVNFEYLF